MKKKKSTAKAVEKKKLSPRAKRWLIVASVLLVAALIAGAVLFTLSARAAAVWKYESVTLREDAYEYWLACYKYEYLRRYKYAAVTDSESGWAKEYAEGEDYGQAFDRMITRDMQMRLVAAALFDKRGEKLSTSRYKEIADALADMEEYSYGEDVGNILRERWGVKKKQLKTVALIEEKYAALREELFGADGDGIYDAAFTEKLEEFYLANYFRFRFIYIADENDVTGEKKYAVSQALVGGISEDAFAALEAKYTDNTVTQSNYPGGIYLCGAGDYSRAFDAALLQKMGELDAPGDTGSVRASTGDGTYYVMRYALDEKPYLDPRNAAAFSDLPSYTEDYLYRTLLEEKLPQIRDYGVAATHSVRNTATCERGYNILSFLSV